MKIKCPRCNHEFNVELNLVHIEKKDKIKEASFTPEELNYNNKKKEIDSMFDDLV